MHGCNTLQKQNHDFCLDFVDPVITSRNSLSKLSSAFLTEAEPF